MAYEIIFAKKAVDSIGRVVDYLESAWSQKVADVFVMKLNEHINMLASGIVQGKPAAIKDVKSVLVTKQNRLYYSLKNGKIYLLLLWDTRQNPFRNPYE